MKTIVKRQNPLWSDFPNFLDSFVNDWSQGSVMKTPAPPVNVKETDKNFEIEVAAPGYQKEDFKVEVEQNMLKISASQKQEHKEEQGKYNRREFSYQAFTRAFHLPENTVETANISAKYESGILYVSIPKKTEAHKVSKTIEVA